MQYTKLVWAIPVGLFIFGDEPKLHVLAGALVVIGSVLYLLSHQRRSESAVPKASTKPAAHAEPVTQAKCLEEEKLG
jgi:cytochrome c-type biogenesis protein CcmH/NrfF